MKSPTSFLDPALERQLGAEAALLHMSPSDTALYLRQQMVSIAWLNLARVMTREQVGKLYDRMRGS